MAEDAGTLAITSAGTAEKFSADLDSNSSIRAGSVVTSISFRARPTNSGNVFIGTVGRDATTLVTSTYGFTLEPGDFFGKNDISEKFDNWEADAATSGDKIDWEVTFTVGAKK